MPKINFLLAAENLNSVQDQRRPNDSKLVIIQPILNMTPPFIPTQLTIKFAAGITGLIFNTEYTFVISIINPNGIELWRDEGKIFVPPEEGKTSANAMLQGEVQNFVVELEGEYKIIVEILGDDKAEYSFVVKKG